MKPFRDESKRSTCSMRDSLRKDEVRARGNVDGNFRVSGGFPTNVLQNIRMHQYQLFQIPMQRKCETHDQDIG